MDQDVESAGSARETQTVDAQALDQASQPFVGRWNQLVSHTNWEKGRIIQQWREALRESGAPSTEYSDDAWSRRVGGVTGQHVGRLRRVYQRFGLSYQAFSGLYWSHFQAALEWADAEMWLEGAVQNGWSVAHMRQQRWDTLGTVDAQRADEGDVISGELDEDFEPAAHAPPGRDASRSRTNVTSEPRDEGPDFGEDDPAVDHGFDDAALHESAAGGQVDFVRPFAELNELPEDLAAAFEGFKLAILHHRLDGWQRISPADVLASLDALKQLVVAP